MVTLVAKELVLELVFGSAADWLKSNLWIVGDFLAWRWSGLALGFIVGVGVLGILIGGQGVVAAVNATLTILGRVPRSWSILIHGEDEHRSETTSEKPVRTGRKRTAHARPREVASGDGSQLVGYGSQHHIGRDSVALIYGIYERNSVTVTCKVTTPDNVYYSRSAGIEVGLSYYPVRFTYPDDFDAPALSKGRYRVVWTKGMWRTIQRGLFNITAVIHPEERWEEGEIGTDEFTIERSAARKAGSRRR